MADSPKCIPCLNASKEGQTYRLAGQPNFKCKSCGIVYHEGLFEAWELKWKDDPELWASKIKERKLTEDGKKSADKIAKQK